MSRGRSRPGAGRKPGSVNKAMIERRLRAEHGVEAAVNAGEFPLDVMLRRMRGDLSVTDQQLEAAQAAAPYVHARLASATTTHKDAFSDLTYEQLAALAALVEEAPLSAHLYQTFVRGHSLVQPSSPTHLG